jgi:hypothetical protein
MKLNIGDKAEHIFNNGMVLTIMEKMEGPEGVYYLVNFWSSQRTFSYPDAWLNEEQIRNIWPDPTLTAIREMFEP